MVDGQRYDNIFIKVLVVADMMNSLWLSVMYRVLDPILYFSIYIYYGPSTSSVDTFLNQTVKKVFFL